MTTKNMATLFKDNWPLFLCSISMALLSLDYEIIAMIIFFVFVGIEITSKEHMRSKFDSVVTYFELKTRRVISDSLDEVANLPERIDLPEKVCEILVGISQKIEEIAKDLKNS